MSRGLLHSCCIFSPSRFYKTKKSTAQSLSSTAILSRLGTSMCYQPCNPSQMQMSYIMQTYAKYISNVPLLNDDLSVGPTISFPELFAMKGIFQDDSRQLQLFHCSHVARQIHGGSECYASLGFDNQVLELLQRNIVGYK